MSDENGLVRREAGATTSLGRVFTGGASGRDYAKVGIGAAGLGAAGFGLDQAIVHGGGALLGAAWANGEPAILAAGIAAAAGVALAGAGRAIENDQYSEAEREAVRQKTTSFYRRVAGVGAVVAGTAAAVAAGMAGAHDVIGMAAHPGVIHLAAETAQIAGPAALASFGVSRHFAKRSATLGPNALAE